MIKYIPLFEEHVVVENALAFDVLKKVLDDAGINPASYYFMYKGREEYSSKVIGDLIRLKIHKDWTIPFGVSDIEFIRGIMVYDAVYIKTHDKKYFNIFRNLYDGFMNANPDLKREFPVFNYRNATEIIHGAISKFNTDDIRFFVDTMMHDCRVVSAVEKDSTYRALINKIERYMANRFKGFTGFNYVMSPETMRKVASHLNINETKTNRFPLGEDKWQIFYDSLYKEIFETNENFDEIERAKDILHTIKKSHFWCTKGQYDYVKGVIDRNKSKSAPIQSEEGIEPVGPIKTISPIIHPPVRKENFIPVAAMRGFWRKLEPVSMYDKGWKLYQKVLKNIEKRKIATYSGKRCYPATNREHAIMQDFKNGRLKPENYPAYN